MWEREIEREREREAWHITHYLKIRTNQAWPSVSMTQKSMTYRDTAYLKHMDRKSNREIKQRVDYKILLSQY